MTQKSARYIEGSQVLIQQAHEELEKGDLRQASEKAWGAAAQAVKAIGEERGWNHDSHALLFDAVGQVNDERRRGRLLRLFSATHQMHINYYEDWLEESDVQDGINTVEVFLQRMEGLRQPYSGGFVPRTDRQRARLARLTGN